MSTEPTPLRPVQDGDDGGGRSSRSPQRSRPSRGLPTDRMTFDVQVDVLRAYGRLSGRAKHPIDADTIAKSVSVGAATARLCNRFFKEAGWLVAVDRGSYAASDSLLDYNLHRRPDGSHEREAVRYLADEVRDSWFWQALAPMLAEGPIDRHDALIVLSRQAGADDGHEPQIENLLQWLDFIGLIQMEDDRIRAADSAGPAEVEDDEEPSDDEGSRDDGSETTRTDPAGTPADTTMQGSTTQNPPRTDYVLTFDVSLRLTADDLATLSSDQIRTLYEAVGMVAAIKARN